MNLAAMRTTIELAKRHEAETAQMEHALAQQMAALHAAVKLPPRQPLTTLLNFVIAYIEHVPNCLEAAAAISGEASIDEQIKPLLQLAEDYFLKPSELTDNRVGLDELMNEAYLAHRLIEEANDYYRITVGIPLLPVDMTAANLISHHLIGEPFANELDEAVQFSIEQLLLRQPLAVNPAFQQYINTHRSDGWKHEQKRWPCLTQQLTVDLQLTGF